MHACACLSLWAETLIKRLSNLLTISIRNYYEYHHKVLHEQKPLLFTSESNCIFYKTQDESNYYMKTFFFFFPLSLSVCVIFVSIIIHS